MIDDRDLAWKRAQHTMARRAFRPIVVAVSIFLDFRFGPSTRNLKIPVRKPKTTAEQLRQLAERCEALADRCERLPELPVDDNWGGDLRWAE